MPDNDYFNLVDNPANNSQLSSAQQRSLWASVKAAFDMFPPLAKLLSGATNSATTTGSADAYIASISSVTAYADLQRYTLKINVDNTGATTLNISSLGTRSVKRLDGSALQAGDLVANRVYDFAYNAYDDTIVLMTQMPETVASTSPTYITITSTDPITTPTVKTEEAAVTVSAGNFNFNLDVASVFEITLSADATATFTASDATKAYKFDVIVTATGSFTFTALLMTGVDRYKRTGLTRLIQPSGITVVSCIYAGAGTQLFVSPVEVEAVT